MKPLSVGHRIAQRIRRLRKAGGLSLDAVAAKASVSKSLLSKIENEKVSSPISTYSRIAVALGTTVGGLLGEGDGGTCTLVRRGERTPMPRSGSQVGYVYEALGHKRLDKRMEPFLVTFPAGRSEPPTFISRGEEFIFLLKGRLEFVHGRSAWFWAQAIVSIWTATSPTGGHWAGATPSRSRFPRAAEPSRGSWPGQATGSR